MYFHTLEQLFAMGGYGEYVWPVCGIVFAVLVGNTLHSLWYYRKTLIQLKEQNESIT
jgi:heme exporter protein CcmD